MSNDNNSGKEMAVDSTYKDFDPKNFDFDKAYEDIKSKIQKPNILLCGATGVGKSSLVNCVFGEELAEVGVGRPVTKGIDSYERPEKTVVLYDSEGYEVGSEANQRYFDIVVGFVKDRKNTGPENEIHLAWYCISAANKRVTDMDAKVVRQLKALGVPTAVVFTQIDCIDEENYGELTKAAREMCQVSQQECFGTCALDDEKTQKSLGEYNQIDALLDWSIDNLDGPLKSGFVAALKRGLAQKVSHVRNVIIPRYVASAAAIGATPIPISDAMLLMPLQVLMTIHITNEFGMNKVQGALKSLVGSTMLSQAGKLAASSLIKLIPGIGSLVGAAVNAGVAGTLTWAMGFSICELCRRYCEAKVNGGGKEPAFSQILNEETVTSLFKQFSKEGKK